MRSIWIVGAGMLVALGGSSARAAGDLDPTFGTGGIVALQLTDDPAVSDEEVPIALQADGKIVLVTKQGAGDFAFQRLEANGSIDATFGSGPAPVLVDAGGNDQPVDVAIQPGGEILAVGFRTLPGGRAIVLVRLDSTGGLDASFGAGGVVLDTPSPPGVRPTGIALQSNGGILVSGLFEGIFAARGFVRRYHPDGTVDGTFNGDGLYQPQQGLWTDVLHSVLVQPDDKIVTAGMAFHGGDYGSWLLVRLLPDGTPDESFGIDGVVEQQMGSVSPEVASEALALLRQPDGKLLAAGSTGSISLDWPSDFGSARFGATGTIDTAYGVDGAVRTRPIPSSSPELPIAHAARAGLHSDGSILLVGPGTLVEAFPGYKTLLVRYEPDGALDLSWGLSGIVGILGFIGRPQMDVAIQPDDDVVLATRNFGVVQIRRFDGNVQCGNGFLDAGEACDDGNASPGDCCSSTCTLEGDGSPCDDGNACTFGDQCSGSTCAGSANPPSACRLAAKSTFVIRSTNRTLDWKWTKGAATTVADVPAQQYTLCISDSAAATTSLSTRSSCGTQPCFRLSGTRTTYKDRPAGGDGIASLVLKAGVAGRSAVTLSGKGPNVALPQLPLTPPALVRLVGANGTCFEAEYMTFRVNDGTGFRATLD